MPKAKAGRRSGHGAGPYDKSQKSNNIFKMNKDFGQHILKNPGVSDAIVQKAFIQPTDTVLEVGPGTGNLTIRALPLCRKLIAVELDPRMAAEVTKRVQGTPEQKKLEVILGDVIKMDFPPRIDNVLSNTPYQISSPLIFKILSMPNPPRVATLMLQREFALRLVARPGDPLRCRLSANVQKWAKVTHLMKVSAKNFNPPPKVESSVVRIEPKLGSERPTIDYNEWDGLLRIAFSRRNKTLRASFLATKQVVSMLEKNYRTYCSLNGIPLDDGVADAKDGEMDLDDGEDDEWNGIADDDGGDMDVDDAPDFFKEMAASNTPAKTPSRKPKTKVGMLVRQKIQRVLDETELGEKRASKIDETDFLSLLHAFNQEGIHFA